MTPATLRELIDALDALGLLLVRVGLDRTGLSALAADAQGRAIAICFDASGAWTVAATDDGTELRGPELLPILRAEIARRWPA